LRAGTYIYENKRTSKYSLEKLDKTEVTPPLPSLAYYYKGFLIFLILLFGEIEKKPVSRKTVVKNNINIDRTINYRICSVMISTPVKVFVLYYLNDLPLPSNTFSNT